MDESHPPPNPPEPPATDEAAPDDASSEEEPFRRRVLRALRPYPFEIFALVNLAVAVAFLRSHYLRIDGRGFSYIVEPLLRSLLPFFAIGVVAAVVARFLFRQPVVPYLRRIARLGWVVHWLRLWIGVILVTYAYGWLKVNVPLVNHQLWDEALWNLDVFLHFGVSPSVFVTQVVAGTPLVDLLDRWYTFWMTTVMAGLCFFTAYLRPLDARRFAFSMLLLWGLGAWIYVAVPALGPIYAFPGAWSELVLPRALGTQADLWRNYEIMVGGRTGQIYSFNPIKGVAAMPSLHVGVHAFFAFFSRRYARPLWAIFLLATFLTFFGSVLTGWHYAVDGYVGIALAWVCYRVAQRLETPRGQEKTDDLDAREKTDDPDDRDEADTGDAAAESAS